MSMFSISPSFFHRSILSISALAMAAMLSGELISLLEPAELSARLKSKRTKKTESSALEIKGGIGVGVFQDIQVPVNEEVGIRADGKQTESEFQNTF